MKSKNTPISLLSLTLLLASLPLRAQEAPAETTDLAGPGVDALAKSHNELNGLIANSIKKLEYIKQNAHLCTRYNKELNDFLIKPFTNLLSDHKKILDAEIKQLKGAIQSKRDSFENVNACVGYKATAIADFKAKQLEIIKARDKLYEGVTKPAAAAAKKLYTDRDARLFGQTGFSATVKALTPDDNFRDCPAKALTSFHEFAKPNSNGATLNVFVSKMNGLSALLNSRHKQLNDAVASIDKTDCTSIAAVSVESGRSQQRPNSDIAVAPEVARIAADEPLRGPLAPDVAPAAAPLAANELAPAPPVARDPVAAQRVGSNSVVGDALTEQVREERRAAEPAVPQGPAIAAEGRVAESAVGREPAAIAPAAHVKADPEALTANDKWNAPDWKKYDQYKASINAPNKVADVNVGQHYSQFLSSNSVQVRSEEDALRLQKAINAASMQVNGDGVGVSVYQDGRVGSRTMSAAYLMQNDPVYRPVFLAELRKQGLIR